MPKKTDTAKLTETPAEGSESTAGTHPSSELEQSAGPDAASAQTSADGATPALTGAADTGLEGSGPDGCDRATAVARAASDGDKLGDEAGAKRPRRGRVSVELAHCSLGEVMNISATGLRARFKGPRKNLPSIDERFNMQVQTPDGPASVRGRVAWIKRVGFRTFDIGVHLVPVNENSGAKLRQLATMAGRSIVITEMTGGSSLRAG